MLGAKLLATTRRMLLSRAELFDLAFLCAGFATAAFSYPSLPDVMATHWDARGVPNGFMQKEVGAFVVPGVATFVYGVFVVILRTLPAAERTPELARVVTVARRGTLLLLLVVGAGVLFAAMGRPVPLNTIVVVGIGALVTLLGARLATLTKNRAVGIRTRWTLRDDEVWRRTHALGGKLFVAAGLVLMAGGLFGAGIWLLFPTLLVMALVPAAYSFVVFRRVHPRG